MWEWLNKIWWQGTLDYGKVQRIQSEKSVSDSVLLNQEIQNGPPYFLNAFSERILGTTGSRLNLRLGQQFVSEGLYMHNQTFTPLS